MSAVQRTRRARVDLLQIWIYVAERNAPAADRVVHRLNASIAAIGRNPMIGEAIDHLAPGLRRLTTGSHVVIFRPIPEGVRLLRVFHASRDIAEMIDGIDEAHK